MVFLSRSGRRTEPHSNRCIFTEPRPAEQRESAMTHAYRMRPLYKGKPEGGWAYHKLAVEIADMIEDADEGRVYEVERVAMTQGEFEALPDFEGW